MLQVVLDKKTTIILLLLFCGRSIHRFDDLLNEDWFRYRMVRSHRSAVTAIVGAGRHR
jgi:hypothetical protein